jgi:hypothetical protein
MWHGFPHMCREEENASITSFSCLPQNVLLRIHASFKPDNCGQLKPNRKLIRGTEANCSRSCTKCGMGSLTCAGRRRMRVLPQSVDFHPTYPWARRSHLSLLLFYPLRNEKQQFYVTILKADFPFQNITTEYCST